jgi:hypothetical protein
MKIIITESQYSKLIKEYDDYSPAYPGTVRVLGSDGVGTDVMNDLLNVIPILFSAETITLPFVNKVKSQGKLKNEDYKTMAYYINNICNDCQKLGHNFNKITGGTTSDNSGMCGALMEVLYSDKNSKFSHSYGFKF